jgi:hypothetical protein
MKIVDELRAQIDLIKSQRGRSGYSYSTIVVTSEYVEMLEKIVDMIERESFTTDELWQIYFSIRASRVPIYDLANRVGEMYEKRVRDGLQV